MPAYNQGTYEAIPAEDLLFASMYGDQAMPTSMIPGMRGGGFLAGPELEMLGLGNRPGVEEWAMLASGPHGTPGAAYLAGQRRQSRAAGPLLGLQQRGQSDMMQLQNNYGLLAGAQNILANALNPYAAMNQALASMQSQPAVTQDAARALGAIFAPQEQQQYRSQTDSTFDALALALPQLLPLMEDEQQKMFASQLLQLMLNQGQQ